MSWWVWLVIGLAAGTAVTIAVFAAIALIAFREVGRQ